MREFDKIYLSWRKGQGNRRHIVGVIERTPDDKFRFSYIKENIEDARQQGFVPYTEFPEFSTTYNGTALDIFAQRLTKADRPDIQRFYDFWEIAPENKNDKFYLLGHTQGLLPTDNFEFLADYNPVDGIHFLTELAGLTQAQLPGDTLNVGDTLRFEIEKDNLFDPEAVKVFKGDVEVGYIKKIHCRIFHKPGADKLKLSVKAIDKNGIIKRVFIKVFN